MGKMAKERGPGRKAAGIEKAVWLGMGLLVIALNGAAWNSTAFCDWYVSHIFPIWVNTYGRLTGMFPFSVGEWMIVAGVVLVLAAVLLGIMWAVGGIAVGLRLGAAAVMGHRSAGIRRFSVQTEGKGGKEKGAAGALRRFSKRFFRFFVWTLLTVCLVMTLNCLILYHASSFSERYFGGGCEDYTLEELIAVYNMAAERCNSLAEEMDRDETGMVLYKGSVGRDGRLLDMEDMAREVMGDLGRTYPGLDGYYPRPKALLSSDFMCQQHMQGYYFPFSMEANYNHVMHILNYPSTMCHELAHLRGFIYEDEANFIGYLACVQSEDLFFQYAGYLSVLVYLNNDIYYAWRDNREAYEKAAAAVPPVVVDDQVWKDNVFVTQEEWDRINRKAWFDTDIVDKAADVFIDTNLKLNGIAEGKISYSRVVGLLLQYYRMEGLPGDP